MWRSAVRISPGWPNWKSPAIVASVVLCVVAGAVTNTAAERRTPHIAGATRTIYFSARGADGAPVTNLTIADLSLTAMGESWPIVQLRKATTPIDVAVIVSYGASGEMHQSLLRFLQQTLPNGRFSIRALDHQPLKIVDYTNDPKVLQSAILQLRPHALSVVSTYLADAVDEAAKELRKRQSPRPVILVLATRAERSAIDAPEMAEAALTSLQRSGASLQVLMRDKPSSVDQLLSEGSARSGGVITYTSDDGLETIRETLLSQYELVYSVLDGYRADDRIVVRTSRPGVTLIAPATAVK